MKKILLIIIVAFSILYFGCDDKNSPEYKKMIVSEKFTSENSYTLVCRGLLNESTSQMVRVEMAKQAALLNAQFYVKNKFRDSVNPIKDGIIEKYVVDGNSILIHYTINKKNIKNLVK